MSEFAEAQGIHHSDAKKLVPLGYLVPNIIEDILNGHQPVELAARYRGNWLNLASHVILGQSHVPLTHGN